MVVALFRCRMIPNNPRCDGDGSRGTGEQRLLHVGASGNLTIRGLTLANGCADGPDDQDDGGAIFNRGELSIENARFVNNASRNYGGAIYNAVAGATVTIANSEFSGNTTSGLYSEEQGSLFNGGGPGGALANLGNVTAITNSYFFNNVSVGASVQGTTGLGGAIYHSGEGSIGLIAGNLFEANFLLYQGGLIGRGGALYVEADVTEISNNTFFGNSTQELGAAIYLLLGESATIGTLNNNTFDDNFSQTEAPGFDDGIAVFGDPDFGNVENFFNNIFSGNPSGFDNPHCVNNFSGWANQAGNNLSDTFDCEGTIPTTGGDPTQVTGLDSTNLQDNGGPTFTIALLEDSNARDAGNRDACPQLDQRGYARVGTCDIGAYEYAGTPPTPPAVEVVIDESGTNATGIRNLAVQSPVEGSDPPEFISKLYDVLFLWEPGTGIPPFEAPMFDDFNAALLADLAVITALNSERFVVTVGPSTTPSDYYYIDYENYEPNSAGVFTLASSAGAVISQDPAAFSFVEVGTSVDLEVSRGPVQVPVPDVEGKPLADAKADIVAADLTVGDVLGEFNTIVLAGNVISQDPIGGESVDVGSAVDLVVSLGPRPVLVPGVVELSQTEAEAAIVDAGLTVGSVFTEFSDTVPPEHVIRQDPEGGEVVDEGSSVGLVVSLGPESDTAFLPAIYLLLLLDE